MKVKFFNIVLILVMLSLFRIYIIPMNINRVIKIASLFLAIMFMIKNVKEKKYYLNSVTFLGICIVLSSLLGYVNNHIIFSLFIDSTIYSAYLVCAFILIKYGFDNNMGQDIINIFYYIMLFYYVLSIFSIVVVGSAPVLLLQYFAGNKFLTSYYLILFCVMFSIKCNVPSKHKLMYFFLIIFTLYMCYYIKCSTAVVSGLLLLLVYFNNLKIKKILMKKNTMLLTFALSGIFLLLLQSLLNISFVSHIIVDVLHEDLTLTGRTQIYAALPLIIKANPVLGYGYGNQIISSVVGYGNAQNAIFQFIVQFGILGLLSLITIFLKAFTIKRHHESFNIWPFYVYIYVILVSSTVEVSFNYMFFIVLFTIYAFNSASLKKSKER